MRIGFTGTSKGMSPRQKEELTILLSEISLTEFHHGDCVGADEEAHNILTNLGKGDLIHIHPPIDQKKRAFCKGSVRKEKEYLARNKDIVDEGVDLLIVAPKTTVEKLRSGVWSTYRYGLKINRNIRILIP